MFFFVPSSWSLFFKKNIVSMSTTQRIIIADKMIAVNFYLICTPGSSTEMPLSVGRTQGVSVLNFKKLDNECQFVIYIYIYFIFVVEWCWIR
jgi:hypothetical protein